MIVQTILSRFFSDHHEEEKSITLGASSALSALYHKVSYFLRNSNLEGDKQVIIQLLDISSAEQSSKQDHKASTPSKKMSQNIDHRLISDIGAKRKVVRMEALRKLIACGSRSEISQYLPKNELELVVIILSLLIKRCQDEEDVMVAMLKALECSLREKNQEKITTSQGKIVLESLEAMIHLSTSKNPQIYSDETVL